MKKCDVRQYSDMAKCESCGLCWDMNDQFPPECKMYNDQRHEDERTPKNAVKALLFVFIFAIVVYFYATKKLPARRIQLRHCSR